MIAPDLLAAVNVDDLAERLDTVLEHRHLARMLDLVLHGMEWQKSLPPSDPVILRPEIAAVLGPQATTQLCSQITLFLGHISVVRQLIQKRMEAGMPIAALSQPDTRSFSERLTEDPAMPSEVFSRLLKAIYGDIAFLCLLDAARRQQILAPWLAATMAGYVIEGSRAHLSLLASMPGISVPLELIPVEERFDVGGARQRTAEFLLGAQSMALEAERRGQTVYFPSGAPDDD